jgi:prepilin peptidase CpaA
MSLLGLFQLGCLIAFALILVAAGWQDLRSMRIADGLSLAIIASFALWASAGLVLDKMSGATLGLTLACSVGVFAVGALAFAVGALGGGDVKLLSAASLYAGPSLVVDLLLITALVGGVLAMAVLAGAPIGPETAGSDGTMRAKLRSGLPYGPAIAAGGLWVAALLAAS